MTDRIPFASPDLSVGDSPLIERVLESGTLVHGPITERFEAEFAARAGSNHAVSVSSCTAGLHLALMALGVGPGDSVIVPAMTHVATAHAVEFCGARPMFVDVDPRTGNIAVDAVRAAIAPDTKAIIIVHYLGLPCEMDELEVVARSVNAAIIEDCALALDATYRERRAGTLGIAGCFSFYPTKHMTTIEGGMVTTDDAQIADRVRKQKAFGYDRSADQRRLPGIYDIAALGYNYRMNEVEAAVGVSQLEKLDAYQVARKRNWATLASLLSDKEEVTIFPRQLGASESSHFCLNVTFSADSDIDRDRVLDYLQQTGVGCSVHYPVALPLSAFYRARYGYEVGEFPVAEWIAARTLSLPVGPHLESGDVERIAMELITAIDVARSARTAG